MTMEAAFFVTSSCSSSTEKTDKEVDLSPYKSDYVLQLNYMGLKSLPTQLTETSDFKHVTNLYLKRNLLVTLPDDVSCLNNLVVLYLHSNKLTCLPESIGELVNLENLDVCSNDLRSLPDSIGNLTKLMSLKLAYNQIGQIPKSIGRLQQLETLEVMNNKLKYLPVELFDCCRLQTLSVDSNHLHSIPRQIRRLACLKDLSATGNNLVLLPQGLGKNDCLKSTYVDCNCHLAILPIDVLNIPDIGFYRCGTLSISRISDNLLSRLCCITVQHTTASTKTLPLPWEIHVMGDLSETCVPTLLELSLRSTHRCFHDIEWSNLDDLPQMFVPLLATPTAECHMCHRAVFMMAFPAVFQFNQHQESVYVLALCCSVKCLRLCTSTVPLPLVYPTMEKLSLALAVV